MTPVQKARSVFENPSDNPFPAGISCIEQNRLSRWQLKNFGVATTEQLALGVCEEAGELCEALLKSTEPSWVPVIGYEGIYEVSDTGKIRRISGGQGAVAGTELEPSPHPKTGYTAVCLYNGSVESKKRLSVHSIVASAFLGPRPAGFEINHRNGVRSDNRVWNLEYVSHQENMKHALVIGLRKTKSKLTAADVVEIKKMLSDGVSNKSIAKDYEVTPCTISNIATGKTWNSTEDQRDLERTAVSLQVNVGQLAHAVLKHSQAIRGMDDEEAFLEAAGDAVADIIIFAIQMATKLRLDIGTLVVDTIEEVTKRDWSRKGPQPEVQE